LADVKHTVAEQYGVFNLPNADLSNKASPSVFIIKENGEIFWFYLAYTRAPSKTILEHLP
jgi:peroxiredoxin